MRPQTSPTWQLVRAYSTSATYTWSSTSAATATYIFGVWAHDAASISLNDSFASMGYAVQSSACTGVTIGASPPSPVTSGPTLTLTANASGCPSPLYEFLLRPASSSSWQMVRAFSAANTFSWSSSLHAGTFCFGVWVRDAASAGVHDDSSMGRCDTYAEESYSL